MVRPTTRTALAPRGETPAAEASQAGNREDLAKLGMASAAVAHEFRNSLGALANIFALLRRDVPAEGDTPRLLAIAHEELERMNALIVSMLDFAKPTEPEPRRVKVQPLLERVACSARAVALLQDIVIEVEVEPGIPEVSLDPHLLHQALLSLAKNGIEAMETGGRLLIGAALREGALHFWVDDEGAGVSEEVRRRMFEPFFTTKTSGIGLGLALVWRIAEQHGGTVRVEPRAPRGTRVVLVIEQEASRAEGPAPAE